MRLPLALYGACANNKPLGPAVAVRTRLAEASAVQAQLEEQLLARGDSVRTLTASLHAAQSNCTAMEKAQTEAAALAAQLQEQVSSLGDELASKDRDLAEVQQENETLRAEAGRTPELELK